MNEAGVVVAPRMGAIRISPYLYNTIEDIDRAVGIVQSILIEDKG
jgi:selenocysteine lyase/cysteine desulfurase